MKAAIKSQTTYAMRQAVRTLGLEIQLLGRHWNATRKIEPYLRHQPLRLNLGCGPNPKPNWLNIDLFDSNADLCLDIRRPWPFPDGCVSHIYSEHVFEHFELSQEVPHILSESVRVLQDGGEFEVGVPDTEWPIQAYGNPNHEYWSVASKYDPKDYVTQLDHLNYHFRQGRQHQYAWDEETLKLALQKAGFISISRREFDPNIDSESRRVGTLYMKASRPQRQSM